MTVQKAIEILKEQIAHLSDEEVQKLIDEVKKFILFIRQNKDKLSRNVINKDNSKNKSSALIIKQRTYMPYKPFDL